MQEEVISNVKHILILLVVIGILLAISIISSLASEALKGESQTVTASGFIITLHQPVMSCISGDWKIDFRAVNITDPERRSLNIIPLIAFSGSQPGSANIGFANKQGNMGGADIGGTLRGLIALTEGKGGTPNLQFDKANFKDTIPNTQNLSLRVGFWIWTSDTGCVYQSIMPPDGKGLYATSMFDILSYTSINCPATYIGTIYKTIENKCTITPATPAQPPSQLSECEQNGGMCMTGIKCEDASYEYWPLSYDCGSSKICCDVTHIKAYK
jgi:hypothetical protein